MLTEIVNPKELTIFGICSHIYKHCTSFAFSNGCKKLIYIHVIKISYSIQMR